MRKPFLVSLLGAALLASPAPASAQNGEDRARAPDIPAIRSDGGIELLLEARSEDFARSRLEDMENVIRGEMRINTIEIAELSTSGGRLSFRIRDPAQRDRAAQIVRDRSSVGDLAGLIDWEVGIVETNRIVMHPTRAGLDRDMGQAMDAAREIIARRIEALGTPATVTRQGPNRILVQLPGLRDAARLRALVRPGRLEFKLVDTTLAQEQLMAGRAPAGSQILPYPEGGEGARIAVQRRAILTGAMIVDSHQSVDEMDGIPTVTIRFDTEGTRRFARVTQENVNRPFAIVLDNVVVSAPTIQEPILGGAAQIRGAFTVESANALAISLRSGPLPIGLVVIEERALPRR